MCTQLMICSVPIITEKILYYIVALAVLKTHCLRIQELHIKNIITKIVFKMIFVFFDAKEMETSGK